MSQGKRHPKRPLPASRRIQPLEAHLAEAERIYRLVFEAMHEAALAVTPEGTVVFCNAQFGQYVKVPPEQIVGRPLVQFVAPDQRSALTSLLQQALAGPVRQRLVFQRAEGQAVPAHVSAHVVCDSGAPTVCLIASDLTELEDSATALRLVQQQKEELAAARVSLEQHVAERTAEAVRKSEALQTLAAELTLTEQRERRRLAQVLHDHLQQLLVGGKFSATAIRSRATGKPMKALAQQVIDRLEEAIQASRALTFELSPPILSQVGLAGALQWLGHEMRERHGLAVEVQAGALKTEPAEPVRVFLFQAARELLFNIVKHAGVTSARVRVEPCESGGPAHVCVTIEDEGAGFDPGHLKRPDRAGFGLFSVEQRLMALGGRMEIDSAPGRGSRFRLVAPARLIASAAQAAPPPAPDAAAPQARPEKALKPAVPRLRVLLADDHTVVRQSLAALLELHADADVVGQAADGLEAVELARQLHPDVVLIDVSMPRPNGVDATRRILAESPGTRVVGVSMHEEAAMARVMFKAGASAYLSKSGPSEDLINAIRGKKKGRGDT